MTRGAEDRPTSAGGGEAPDGGWWIDVPVDGAAEAIAVARHPERLGCRIAAYGPRGLRVEFPYAGQPCRRPRAA